MAVDIWMPYIFMLVSITFTLTQGHSGSAKAKHQRCMFSATKQAISIKHTTSRSSPELSKCRSIRRPRRRVTNWDFSKSLAFCSSKPQRYAGLVGQEFNVMNNYVKVSNDVKTKMAREPPRTNCEQGMYGKLPTIFGDLDEGRVSRDCTSFGDWNRFIFDQNFCWISTEVS